MLASLRTLRSTVAIVLALPVAVWAQPPAGMISRAPDGASWTVTPVVDPALANVRRAFEKAYDQAAAGQSDPSGDDSASLKAYPLYPYLQAARIEQRLIRAPNAPTPEDARAAAFIARHAGEPVARELRHAWLTSLARRSQWDTFLKIYQGKNDDPALRCESFTARIALGLQPGLKHAIKEAWLTPHSLPECASAFAWLKRRGALSTALVAKRARLALEASDPAFALQVIAELPQGREATELLEWARLLEHPKRGIDALLAAPHRPVEPKALLAGWSLLARKHPNAAEARYWRLVVTRRLSYKAASPYALALALGLAWNREPSALRYFSRVEPSDFNKAALAWRVRAALWSRHWRLTLRDIDDLPRGERRSSRWRYWTARADAALHHTARARRIYTSLLTDDNFYSALAAARLHQRVRPHSRALPKNPGAITALAHIPSVVRARELFYCGLEPYADVEWRFAYARLTPQERLQSIRLAARWGWYVQAIETAADQDIFDAYPLLYPRPFRAEIRVAVKRARLSPALVLGVIRQESLYSVGAVSHAGALGLMQLMPATAIRTARLWGIALPGTDDLFLPTVNIALGTAHLRTLLDQFDGRVSLALASYNAGTRSVLRWLPSKPIAGDIWIENIPYDETRGYVEQTLWHSLLFAWLSDSVPQSARTWLTPVGRAALARPLESRADHIGGRGRRLSWRHARLAQTTIR